MEINCSCRATGKEESCPECQGNTEREAYVGMPVVYVPSHAHVMGSDREYPIPVMVSSDVEWGFVTGENDEFVFCRYFTNLECTELRTKANSEATPPENLYAIQMGAKRSMAIEGLLKEYGYEES